MRIDVISVIPELLSSPLEHSIIKRAVNNGLVEIYLHDLRNYGLGKHKQVDAYAFGGEAGMVLMIEPVFNVISELTKLRKYDAVIYTSPDGAPWNQKTANRFSAFTNIIILCGHYKGIDHRIREKLITHEFSVGDFVLTGGEIAAAIFIDSIVRLIPGAIGDEQSALTDSFQDGLLAPPIYTRPAEFNGWRVPDVLLSGNFPEIEKWKEKQSFERTQKLRPDLLNNDENAVAK
jgi:tRNA (guanine37-N1)-methyltransferase